MTKNGNFDTGSVVEWIVFEIVAFYVNIVELTIQSIMYSTNTFKMVEFIYNVKLVTRIQTLFKLRSDEISEQLGFKLVIVNDDFQKEV
jgi:hypothetical protein